jgi:hypothetical protein
VNVNIIGRIGFPTMKEVDGTLDVTETVLGMTVSFTVLVPLDTPLLAVIARSFDHVLVAVPLSRPEELTVRPGGNGDVDEYTRLPPLGKEIAVN